MGALNQGLILMVTGMVAVYIFLILLVFIVKGFESIAPKLAFILPDPEPPKPKARPVAAVAAGADNAAVALAIAAAAKKAGK